MAVTWQTKQGIALSVGDKFIEESSPEEIAEAMAAEPGEDQGEELNRAIMRVGLRMGLLAYGVQFLEDSGAPADVVESYERDFREALAKATAKEMGLSDWKPLLLKATRTAEQQKVMENLAGRAATNRLRKYLESNYMASIEVLIDGIAAALETDPQGLQQREGWQDDMSEAISLLNRYYYVLHSDIDPAEKSALSGDQQEELSGMAAELVAYMRKHGGGFFESVAPCFHLETVAAARPSSYRQTEFSKSEDIFLPVSKAWQIQHEIGKAGNVPGLEFSSEFDVSTRGKAPAIVKATISDIKGSPLEIDGIRRGAQMAIGNLIDKNGGNLPIVITPDQVYREWACLASNVDITPQQAAEMEAAIDSLTSAPARMDFQAQLQQHTRIKRQPDYDYDSPQAGRLSSNMIMAEKVEAVRKDGSRSVAYRVLSYPMLYRYSHVVGQIAQVKRSLITGGEHKQEVEKGKKAQSGSRDVAMRHNVLTRIERMKKAQNGPRRILLEEVACDLLIPLTEKTERTLRKNLEQYLDELKEQGEIKKYSPLMGGRGNRKYIGFSLIL